MIRNDLKKHILRWYPPYSTNFWNMKAIELIFFALYSSCLIWIMKFFPFLTDFNFSPVFRDLMLTWVKNGAQDISTTLCSIWLIFLHKILITLLNKMSHGIRDILIFHWNIKKIIFRNKIPSSTESKNSITFFFQIFWLIPWLILRIRVRWILCQKISPIEATVLEISWAPFYRCEKTRNWEIRDFAKNREIQR